MELETLKTKEVPMQKLGTLIAEKAWHSHFHNYWGKKEVKITRLSLALTPSHR